MNFVSIALRTLRNVLPIAGLTAGGIALLATLPAQAAPLAVWEDLSGGCNQNAACFQAPGITASSLTGNSPTSTGYLPPGTDAWSNHGPPSTAGLVFDLSMSTSVGVGLSTFNLTVFNNDCENDGFPIDGCLTSSWGVRESVNGGAFGAALATFYSGAPYAETPVSVALNQSLNAGDTITMEVYNINPGSDNPATGQYYFHDISLQDIPEPASLALLGAGLAGAAALRRRKKKIA